MKPICIIPARAGSKRLPGKNKIDFNGHPIICYPIRAALEWGGFDRVIVSSDDPDIIRIAEREGAEAEPRPGHLSGDTMEETNVYLHVLRDLCRDDEEWRKTKLPAQFCAIYPTAAFITPQEIEGAYHKLISEEADVCMGVTKFDIHPYRTLTYDSAGFMGLRWPELNDLPSREFPAAFASNGTLYWFQTAQFFKEPSYFPARLTGFETYAVDIDTPEDLQRAKEQFNGPDWKAVGRRR